MERDIDMGQAVEEAAKLFADRCRINNFQSLLDYPYDDIDMINAFKAGAEWQAKQSPWISVKERLPENQDIVLVRGEYGGKATAYLHGKDSGFIVYGEDAYKVFGEVTHWMPIPDLEE
jgi:hypothetical protein|nr:MAG TPA: Protein of unknown function (DUF551) [Caudoviricetes sp.]